MKYVEVKPLAVQPGNEWLPTSYPGDGLYLTSAYGLMLVAGGTVYGGTISSAQLVCDGEPAAAMAAAPQAPGFDVVRFTDMLMNHLMNHRLDERQACGTTKRR